MNIFQKAITPDMPRVLESEQIYVYVPQATSTNAGIASYKNADFKVNDGAVSLRWPIQSIVQGPLANPSLIKVQDTEFEYSNANTELEYEGSIITSTVSEIQIKRDLRDAHNRPDLVMLDPSYFPRVIVEKDGKQYYKYNTTAVHYNMSQRLSDNEQAQARLNIGAGSLAVVEQSNKNSSEALLKATSAEQTSTEALELVKTSDAAAKEAVVTAIPALTNSSQAITNAGSALTISDEARNTSNTALNTSNNAMSTANSALANASAAISTANSAKSEASQAIITAESANAISVRAEDIAQTALSLVTEGVGSQVLVNGVLVDRFNADTKADVTYVNQKIDDIIGPGSTEAIDTILELADAFKNNSDVIKVLNEAISTKVNVSDLDNYLPLTAGSSKPLTDDLYITSGKYLRLGSNAFMRGDDADGRLTISAGKDRILTIRPNPDNSTGQMHIYGTVFRPGSKDGVQLGTDSAPWLAIYGTTLYQNGKQVANKEDIPDISNLATKAEIPDTSNLALKSELPTTYIKNATVASDGSKLTITKQDGSTLEFQGGSDLSNYLTIDTTQTITGTKNFDNAMIKVSSGVYRLPLATPATEQTGKRYLVGVETAGARYSNYNQSVYMENGVLYSNKKQVANKEDIPTFSLDGTTLTITI